VSKTTTQTIPNGSASATAVVFNNVVDDPLSSYNTGTNIYTVPQTGFYIMGYNTVYQGSSAVFTYISVNGTQVQTSASNTGPMTGTYGAYLTAASTIQILIYANGAGSSINNTLPNNFWVKRVA
jgi:hypothetical protein